MLPFTPEQFLAVFVHYNQAVWPTQIIAYLLGGIAVASLFNPGARSDRIIAGILAIMWAWTGLAYHLAFFAAVNKAAYAFGFLFLVQAGALAYAGIFRHGIAFGFRRHPAAWAGAALALYAALLYPLIGIAAGHHYPELPMFGITPCPVTIFTFGMLLLTVRPPSAPLLVVPILWSLIGGSAAIFLEVPQDWLLLLSGVIAAPLMMVRRSKETAARFNG